jgi:hypothetical protein
MFPTSTPESRSGTAGARLPTFTTHIKDKHPELGIAIENKTVRVIYAYAERETFDSPEFENTLHFKFPDPSDKLLDSVFRETVGGGAIGILIDAQLLTPGILRISPAARNEACGSGY